MLGYVVSLKWVRHSSQGLGVSCCFQTARYGVCAVQRDLATPLPVRPCQRPPFLIQILLATLKRGGRELS